VNRDTLGPILIAVLVVVALGVGAATLDQVGSGGSGVGTGDGDAIGPGDDSEVDFDQPSSNSSVDAPTVPPILRRILTLLLIVAILGSLYVWRNSLRQLAGIAVVVGLAALLLYFLLSSLSPTSSNRTGNGSIPGDPNTGLPGGGSPGEGARTVVTDVPVFAVVAGLALLAGVLVVVWFGWGRDAMADDESPAVDAEEDVASVGRAAGRAADRIDETGEARNEIYRAWEEMTDHLDVENPGSSTPSEFARAATDAGMTRNDVDELTDLFRTVRYGGRRVTDDRENRAVTALRRIEREYAEEP